MNILIDIGHPAHVHMFHNFVTIMLQRGHHVVCTMRQKECEKELLEYYKLPYVSIGTHKTHGRIIYHFVYLWRMWRIARKYHIDFFVSHGSILAAQTAWLTHKKHITFEDTFNKEQVRWYLPFTDYIITADYHIPLHSQKVIRWRMYNELLYLHPKYFIPQWVVRGNYIIIRLVAWNATHDKYHTGLTEVQVHKLITTFSRYGKVYISSENELPPTLIHHLLPTPHYLLHHVLAFAQVVITEGTTVAAECALLGTPNVLIHPKQLPYITDLQQRYGLTNYFHPEQFQQAITMAQQIMGQRLSIEKCLSDHDNPTEKLCNVIEQNLLVK